MGGKDFFFRAKEEVGGSLRVGTIAAENSAGIYRFDRGEFALLWPGNAAVRTNR